MGRVLLTHPLGSPFAAHAAMGLQKSRQLAEIATSLHFDPNGMLARCIAGMPLMVQKKLLTQLGRRTWIPDSSIEVTQFPFHELVRIALMKSQAYRLFGISPQSLADRVFNQFDRHVALDILPKVQAEAVYAFEDSASQSFKKAKSLGMTCIYDLPILYHKESRRIEEEEALLHPEFKSSLYATRDSSEKVARKELELELADHVIVASTITRNSLMKYGYPEKKITVIPYGSPLVESAARNGSLDKRLKVIFVGRIGPRKGVHYLLEAWAKAKLRNAELLLIGINEFGPSMFRNVGSDITVMSSIPHKDLYHHYHSSDVLVLPSIVEGFGMVLLEAMACGLPVIASTHTAGPEIITEGLNGFVTPIRDALALSERLIWCAENREALREMGKAAMMRAKQLSWERYETELGSKVSELLKP